MKVWLLWTGEYSDAGVVGVYSSLELAQAASALYGGAEPAYIDKEEGWEVDEYAGPVLAGVSRWRVVFDLETGNIESASPWGPGAGEPPLVSRTGDREWMVGCDAGSKELAVKIMSDERRQLLVDPVNLLPWKRYHEEKERLERRLKNPLEPP